MPFPCSTLMVVRCKKIFFKSMRSGVKLVALVSAGATAGFGAVCALAAALGCLAGNLAPAWDKHVQVP